MSLILWHFGRKELSSGFRNNITLKHWPHFLFKSNLLAEMLVLCALSQFGYCPLLWMFHSRGSNDRIKKIHDSVLWSVYNDSTLTFEEILIKDLAVDYQLPSVRTLTRIILKVASQNDIQFLQNVLLNIESYQRRCIVLLDEIYIKSAVTYHGGTLFKCLYWGAEFITKILPVSQLTADFILNQMQHIVDEINKHEDGNMIGIIADVNRTNQKFFNNLRSNDEKPWSAGNDTFLLIHACCYLRWEDILRWCIVSLLSNYVLYFIWHESSVHIH